MVPLARLRWMPYWAEARYGGRQLVLICLPDALLEHIHECERPRTTDSDYLSALSGKDCLSPVLDWAHCCSVLDLVFSLMFCGSSLRKAWLFDSGIDLEHEIWKG